MKLLLGGLLLASLRARSSWCFSPGTPVVTQTPDLSVTEGETVNITCCWTWKYDRMRMTWLKNLTVMKIEMFFFSDHFQGGSLKETSDCSRLTFLNVTREDSGRYICRLTMEIPFLSTSEGNGTVITVRSNTADNTAEGSHHGSRWEEVLIYVMRCLPILALVTALCYINSRTKAQRHAPAAPGNKHTSAQRTEERDEREIDAE